MKKILLLAAACLPLWAQEENNANPPPQPPDVVNPPPPVIEQPPPPAGTGYFGPNGNAGPSSPGYRSALPEQERELLDKHRENAAKGKAGRGLKKPAADAKAAKGAAAPGMLNVDYVDEPILDVLRAIATAFKLSIIPDKDLGDVKVTIHLENIPVLEGLEKLCKSHGLELIADGNVYRVRKARETAFSIIEVRNKRMNLDVQNRPVKDFLREFVEKTKINIVPGQDLRGQVTGHLKDVDPIDGFKALMAANDYEVRLKNGVYLVENGDSTGQENQGFRRGRRSGGYPGQPSGNTDVDVHDGKVTLSLNNASLGDAIREIAEQAGINYTFIGDVSGNVNAQLKGVSVNEALSALLNGTRYAYINKDGTLLIGDRNPNTPSGQALSGAELVYLKFIKAENIERIVPKTVPVENIKVIKEQNAVLISGTTDDINLVKAFIEKVDVPTPQVLMEVVVVEYTRDRTSDFGLKPGLSTNPAGFNVNGYGSMSGVQTKWKDGSWTGLIGIKPPNFELNLAAQETAKKAKILSMPKVTTLNGNKAELKVSRTSYFPVSSYNKDGFQNNDFRTVEDGITIELTPWVTKHGEVNVNISPSIKTTEASSNVSNAPSPVTNRSISTNVMLMDGETIALGGLIKSQEDNARTFVPILGSIPLLGYLFSFRSAVTSTSELVIYVTPHILNPESQGVNMEEEFESLDQRSGFLKKKDFLRPGKKEETRPAPAVVPPLPTSRVPAVPPPRTAADSARMTPPQPPRDTTRPK